MQGLRRAAVGLAEGRLGKPWSSPDAWGSRPELLATPLCRKQSGFLLSSRSESFQQSLGGPAAGCSVCSPTWPFSLSSAALEKGVGFHCCSGGTVTICVCAQFCSAHCCPKGCSCQAPLSLEFSRQVYWSGLPFPPPGDLIFGVCDKNLTIRV